MPVQKSSDSLNWDDLKFFTAIADTGRLSAAADRLGVNHVTVSRRIDRLEASLAKKLFARSNDGYALTLDGKELQKNLISVTAALEQVATTKASAESVENTVKISMVHSMAEALVLPALQQLQIQHPKLTFELDTSTRNVSIVKRESDIALRLALPESGDYIARRLANVDYVLCGNEQLAQQAEEGNQLPVVSYNHKLSNLPEARYILEHHGLDSIVLQSNSATVQRSAAINGIGIALLPMFLFKDSELSRIAMKETVSREIWMLARKNSSQQMGVRLVIDSLVELFRNSQDRLIDK